MSATSLARRSYMRKLFALGTLSTLVATALLALVAAAALGDASCEMARDRPAANALITCIPGPTFDCCKGNSAPTSSGSGQLLGKPLSATTAMAAPALIVPLAPWRHEPGRALEPLGARSHVPLYTLLATFLI